MGGGIMSIPSSFNAAAANAAFAAKDAAFDESLEATQQVSAKNSLALQENSAEASQEKLAREAEENASTGMTAQTKKLAAPPRSEKIEKAKEVQESVLVRKEEADQFAGDFLGKGNNKNYHLEMAILSSLAQDLGTGITPKMSSKEIIDHITDRLRTFDPKSGKIKDPDSSQIDKTFEFLLFVTEKKLEKLPKDSEDSKRLTEVAAHIKVAKKDYYDMPGADGKPNSKAIEQAKKIIGLASGVVDASDRSTKEALDELRDILDNPQDVQNIRKEYEKNGGATRLFNDLKTFYHHLGNQLKRVNVQTVDGGNLNPTNMPTLEPSQLQQYTDATQSRRAVAFVYISAKTESKIAEKTMNQAGFINRAAA
ncbi:hypothetical protein DB44_CJ00140 [Candidatus Protochlamydia amoebophila]|uniref:Uncharacterized protein n=2 Tax=Candidatus Protochlamydia amoebophila TaxID=362787 RepID=A0A0C1JM93_9BACT|nr:hypothetical protein DB44_CJ00140 [Candidatus Protochlamydia amoebophila]